MLAGMYVVRDETPTQVAAIYGGVHGYGGTVTAIDYVLVKLGTEHAVTLTNPLATQVPLLPACEDCGAPAGRPCAAPGSRVEPMTRTEWVAEMTARAKGVTNVQ